MNFKITFLKVTVMSLIAVSVSACGPQKNKLEPNAEPVTTLPNSDNSPPKPSVNDIKKDVIAIQKRPLITRPTNLLSRIRNGFAFPELNTKEVQQHERWASEHPRYLNNLFSRAEPFLYFIVDEIEQRGLPMELALLPAVESAYDPGAVSRSKAAGLWQFVPATGKGFGLRQDWWYDGRHDPYSSTFAALDYLEELHAMFDGDWFIALAAYNAGPGTLRREINRAKKKGHKTDYVSLKLRLETRRYIPKLMALKNIVQNPGNYDVVLPSIANQPYFDVVTLPGQIDLVKFAKNSNIDSQELRQLNRGFKRWATSPDGPHRLLIPLNVANSNEFNNIDYAKSAISLAPNVSYHKHTINKGDTLSSIAQTYGVSVQALRSANRLSNNTIRAGKNLMIPTPKAMASVSKSKKQLMPDTELTKAQHSTIKHRVEKGDTLWSISRRYRVNLNELMTWNNLQSNDVLSLNQLLTVFIN